MEPFQKMLQFALQPLLLYVDPIADQPGDVLLLKLNVSCSSDCCPQCRHVFLLSPDVSEFRFPVLG